MVAVLLDGDRAGAVVHAFADGRVVLVPLTSINVPAGRALEVWTLPSRERGPVSVGLMDRARTLRPAAQGPAGARAGSAVRDHAGAGQRLADRTADRADPVQGQHRADAVRRVFYALRNARAVPASAGKNASTASSANVTSTGVPNTVVVLRNASVPSSVTSSSGTAIPA